VTHILLTGAGFSYNWGGMLAHEVFPEVQPKIVTLFAERLTTISVSIK
jgi:hypothetical protein